MDVHEGVRLRIGAPDAPSAFLLERRLTHLRPSAVARGDDWSVELTCGEEEVDEVEAVVKHWLRESGAPATSIEIDGGKRTTTVKG
jgi:hypothetical protein